MQIDLYLLNTLFGTYKLYRLYMFQDSIKQLPIWNDKFHYKKLPHFMLHILIGMYFVIECLQNNF